MCFFSLAWTVDSGKITEKENTGGQGHPGNQDYLLLQKLIIELLLQLDHFLVHDVRASWIEQGDRAKNNHDRFAGPPSGRE